MDMGLWVNVYGGEGEGMWGALGESLWGVCR